VDYIATTWSMWNDQQGARHLWLLPGDNGVCGVRSKVTGVERSIFITHWAYGGACVGLGLGVRVLRSTRRFLGAHSWSTHATP